MRAAAAALALLIPGVVFAQGQCNIPHTIAEGETLFSIADQYYGDLNKWSVIYYGNQNVLPTALLELPTGVTVTIPCLPGQSPADPTPLQTTDAEMTILTGSNYAPFSDRAWMGQGMVTELVNAAMEATPEPVTYAISWEDDWSQHLFPMLDSGAQFDMGFPWLRPNCDENPANERCANFHFSDPLVEILVLLFTRMDDPVKFEEDTDLHGRTICRPAGYFTHDLDRADRRWLSDGLVTLVQAESPAACFAALMSGEVDAVTVNEFLGWTKIHELGLQGRVQPEQRPVSVEGLHVVISKKHWRGTTHLYRFNAGLAALRETERYNEIVTRHLGTFWEQLN